MEEKKNKYIAVAYKLYTNENGTENMVEEAPAERPFQFISGVGGSGNYTFYFCWQVAR